MKRVFKITILSLVVLLSLTACKSKPSNNDLDKGFKKPKTVEEMREKDPNRRGKLITDKEEAEKYGLDDEIIIKKVVGSEELIEEEFSVYVYKELKDIEYFTSIYQRAYDQSIAQFSVYVDDGLATIKFSSIDPYRDWYRNEFPKTIASMPQYYCGYTDMTNDVKDVFNSFLRESIMENFEDITDVEFSKDILKEA